jgi:hypothetical protein
MKENASARTRQHERGSPRRQAKDPWKTQPHNDRFKDLQ